MQVHVGQMIKGVFANYKVKSHTRDSSDVYRFYEVPATKVDEVLIGVRVPLSTDKVFETDRAFETHLDRVEKAFILQQKEDDL
jgi:hypothetical protein